MQLIYFLLGSVTVFSDYASITEILNICMFCCIPYTDFKTSSDGVRLRLRLSAFKRLEKEAQKRGLSVTVEHVGGIPSILGRYKRRYGIFVGIALAVSLIVLSRLFIWDIDVVGNERLTTTEIREILKGYGFGVGTYIPSVNTDRIENKILIDTDRISWISINVIGNVAEVQVREYEDKTEEKDSTRPANLIASKPGLVREVRIRRGNVVVGSGKYVEKGELLVSGLFDSNILGFRYTRAEGEVYAETVSEYYVEIPYEYEGVVYTGEEYCDKYLNFFDFSINIYKNSRKEDALYDKIDIVENCSLPDGTETPFEIRTVKYSEYEMRTLQRSAEEAEELAYFSLGQHLANSAEDSIIIKKTVTPRVGEKSFSLYCVVVAVENIAAVSEFDVSESVIE
jgi:similar to stage IV sporulation protein